jgi:small-conductance mechanosensitive channel
MQKSPPLPDDASPPAVAPSTPRRTAEVRELESQPDVREALVDAGGAPRPAPAASPQRRLALVASVLGLATAFACLYALRLNVVPVSERWAPLVERVVRGITWALLVVAVSMAVDVFVLGRTHSVVARYNLRRVLRLVVALSLAFIAIQVLFANWKTTIVSIGLVSLVLGFALQTPITSFIGWVYILLRQPFRVGDRIKIGDATGDVIDVSYLDTTLWEFGGDYLSTDHPSGRIIKFPNSSVLNTAVYNYSWPLFPYIWNEVKFHVGYDSDLEFVANTMQRVTAEELGSEMMERVRVFRELLARTPVAELNVKEYPAVLFRVSDNTWLEAIVRYLVLPRESGSVKTRLIQKLLAQLNAAPERVRFPKGDAR